MSVQSKIDMATKHILIVGLSGKIGAGKDTLGEAMLPHAELNGYKVQRRAFGDALKEECADFLVQHSPKQIRAFIKRHAQDRDQATRTINQLLGTKRTMLGSRIYMDYRGASPGSLVEAMNDRRRKEQFREWMIFYGTEYRRVCFGEDYWLRQIETYIYKIIRESPEDRKLFFYIPDVRFLSEVKFTQDMLHGYVVRVERPSLVAQLGAGTHRSETELDTYKFFNMTVINNKTLQTLKDLGPVAFLQALSWKLGAANVSQTA